ncbi:MAG: porin [Lentisphaerae bacterium]|nr:porin [Lentisphaerota bacterium]
MRRTIWAAMLVGVLVSQARGEGVDERVARLESQVEVLQASGGGSAKPVTIGGYGELHYNNLSGEGGASDKDAIDFHRFVLFFGYEFNERVRLVSEVELEHSFSGGDAPGEVELEQAYVDFDLNESHTARAGLFLLPVGLINETHEPPRFYGVEGNPVETRILPTTWWEGGAGVHGRFGEGWNYGAYVHSGLKASSNSSYTVRSGRQKVAEADASEPAATVALGWSAPGVSVGGALVYQADVAQGAESGADSALLGEIHGELRHGPVALRALYAEWSLDGMGPESIGADRQQGWYVEPSYKPCEQLGFFARYSEWDNTAGDLGGASGKVQVDVGINCWPHEQVVLTVDYQWQDNDDGKDQNGLNLGMGYEF